MIGIIILACGTSSSRYLRIESGYITVWYSLGGTLVALYICRQPHAFRHFIDEFQLDM